MQTTALYNITIVSKRDAGNHILNTFSQVTSAIFLAWKTPTGIYLQSELCITHSKQVLVGLK